MKIYQVEELVGITKKNIRFYEEQNAQVMKELCAKLRDETADLKTLNASFYLSEMEKMENQGTKFKDIQKEDINRKKKSGEIAGYTEMLNEARQLATKRMVDEATALGADAIVGVRYGSSAVMQGAAEIVAYGTAVKFR